MVKKIFKKKGHVKKIPSKVSLLKKSALHTPPKYSNQDISLLKQVFYLPTPNKVYSIYPRNTIKSDNYEFIDSICLTLVVGVLPTVSSEGEHQQIEEFS